MISDCRAPAMLNQPDPPTRAGCRRVMRLTPTGPRNNKAPAWGRCHCSDQRPWALQFGGRSLSRMIVAARAGAEAGPVVGCRRPATGVCRPLSQRCVAGAQQRLRGERGGRDAAAGLIAAGCLGRAGGPGDSSGVLATRSRQRTATSLGHHCRPLGPVFACGSATPAQTALARFRLPPTALGS